MRSSTRRELVAGPAGKSNARSTIRKRTPRGAALVAHPHPLFGGTLDNKVAQTLARAFVELGYTAWRPNFRGVGATEGTHDEGAAKWKISSPFLNCQK
jgi:alpha/beta superfamily hydrolase